MDRLKIGLKINKHFKVLLLIVPLSLGSAYALKSFLIQLYDVIILNIRYYRSKQECMSKSISIVTTL
jgi:hypothetical protein